MSTRRPRRRLAEVSIALVAASVVTTGTVRAVTDDGSAPAASAAPVVGPTTSIAPAPSAAPAAEPTTPPAPRTRPQVLADLRAYTARQRGLAFTAPVDVRLLPRRQFDGALVRAGRAPAPGMRVAAGPAYTARVGTLLALGIARSRKEVRDYYAGAGRYERRRAFYDARTDRLLVRGGTLTPATQLAVVHELVHALQDQRFGDRRPPGSLEAARALEALVEGDATRVASRWLLDQPLAFQRAVDREDLTLYGDAANSPDALSIYDSYAELAGPALVARLLGQGGQARLDRAFRSPPTTTEQVLDPTLRAPALVRVPPRPRGTRLLETGVLGELGLTILLQEYPLSPGAARAWRGDRYVTYAAGGATCTTVWVRTSSAGQQRALRARAARVVDSARPLGRTGVVLRGCTTK